MISRLFSVFTIVLVLAGFQAVSAQLSRRLVQVEPADVTVLYDNGEFRTGATSESGIAAPNGYVWSENQHNTGDLTVSNSVGGFGTTYPQVRLADNFTVPAGQTWIISSVTVWGFQQSYTGSSSPFSGATLQIWNGAPGDAGSSVIYGDTTTDRLLSSTPSNAYVIFNSVAPAPGNTPGTQRFLWENKLSVAPSLTLGPGTYWIDFAATSYNGVSANFHRNVISPGHRTQPGWNARQFVLSSNSWEAIDDGGQPSSAPDVPQDIAFQVSGTVTGKSSNSSTFADFDGDGKVDFGVIRWAALPTAPSDWYILKSGGTGGDYAYATFGLRAGANRNVTGPGIADISLPEDYDGDGKADIAVYRDGQSTAEPQSYCYIMNSSDNTVSFLPFGLRGDIAYIMGDYDGDDKADLAVWRQGTTAAPQSTFYVQKSSDGQLIVVNFGLRGDRPVLGDFDGDGKQDFSVARVNIAAGEAVFYSLQSADNSVKISTLPYPFVSIVPGDYDGDGKTDIATTKRSLNDLVWTITQSSNGVTQNIRAGNAFNDIPVQGDYNGDGKTQIAVYRKTGTTSSDTGTFWVRQEDGSYSVIPWGNGFDFPIAGRVY